MREASNRHGEFFIGGFIPGANGLGSLIVGYYSGADLIYATKVRAGLNPSIKGNIAGRLAGLVIEKCPFVNLPEAKRRWVDGLTKKRMEECVWVRPELVAQIKYESWTYTGHVRHSRFLEICEHRAVRTLPKQTSTHGVQGPVPSNGEFRYGSGPVTDLSCGGGTGFRAD